MREFAPVIESWTMEADATLAAAALKPEAACEAAMGEMARRGESIRADLAGMGVEQDEARRADVDREAEQGRDEEQGREGAGTRPASD